MSNVNQRRTYVFSVVISGSDNWTDGKDCEARLVQEAGQTFVYVNPRKPGRPWDKAHLVPTHLLKHIDMMSGYIPEAGTDTDRKPADTDRKPAFVASEAPGGTVPGAENVPRRGRPPKAAVEE